VRQLGLAYYVFSGGDFSRLSHCLGVLHVAGAILGTLKAENPAVVTPEVEHDLKISALVHDIGHLPFSHTMESAARRYYEEAAVPVKREGGGEESVEQATLKHEEIGAKILLLDPEISRLLSPDQAERIGEIIQGNNLSVLGYQREQSNLGRLISSDLDADRLDYLMRTALHTGLPYGGVDLPYLLSQIKLDNEYRICFRARALHAVDHCLLGRYFDRMTVAFHKTVAGFELLLEEVIEDLLREGLVTADAAEIQRKIETGSWADFHDGHMLERMRELRDRTGVAPDVKTRVEAILNRRAPKMVAQLEYVGPSGEQDDYQDQLKSAKQAVEELNSQAVDTHWYLWKQEGFTITSLASGEQEQETHADVEEEEERPKDVLIVESGSAKARSIRKVEASLMTALGDKSYYAQRIYALSPSGGRQVPAKQRERLRSTLTDRRWRWFFN
jgi:HD superfamily phosphohydrolase